MTYFLNSWLDQQAEMSDDAKRTLRDLGNYDAFEKNVLCEDISWMGGVAESTRKAISFLEAADWGSRGSVVVRVSVIAFLLVCGLASACLLPSLRSKGKGQVGTVMKRPAARARKPAARSSTKEEEAARSSTKEEEAAEHAKKDSKPSASSSARSGRKEEIEAL